MLLSIVINTFERPAILLRCLAHVGAESAAAAAAIEVIVVDDGGGMDLSPALSEFQQSPSGVPLNLIRIEHAGRAAARNRGVEAARGRRILFLGDDVMVQPGCLARHAAVVDPAVAVVGPYPWMTLRGSPPFRRWAEPNPQDDIADPANAGFMHFATGNLSMDRERFLRLGGFDEAYTLYGWEDLDLGLRFERSGGCIRFDPAARAHHEHPAMPRQALWRREHEMGYTAFQFAERWREIAPEAVRQMIFWDDPAVLRPGPAWRRAVGDRIIAVLDHLAPDSRLNHRLYQRMVFASRYAGLHQAWLDRHSRRSKSNP